MTLLIGGLIPLARICISTFVLVDTPAYYIKKNNQEKAKQVLRKLYVRKPDDNSIDHETYEKVIQCILHEENSLIKMSGSSEKEIETPQIKKPLLNNNQNNNNRWEMYKPAFVGFFVWYFNQFTGVQGVNSYSSKLFREFVSGEKATFITITMNF